MIEDFLVPSEGELLHRQPRRAARQGDGLLRLACTRRRRRRPSATNTAFEINARKRFTNNWQFLASYVSQKLEGNYDGTFQNSTGQLDPNINSAFDYADFLVNAEGR